MHRCVISNYYYILGSDKLCGLVTKKTKSLKTCLHIACQSAKFDIVELLVKTLKQLEIEYKDELGWNALHFAAKGGNLEILKYLLKKGLKADSLTKDKKTILHIACRQKQVDICRYAVDNFQSDLLNAKTSLWNDCSALFRSAERRNEKRKRKINSRHALQ